MIEKFVVQTVEFVVQTVEFVVQTVALPSGVIAGEDRDVSSTTVYCDISAGVRIDDGKYICYGAKCPTRS